MNQPNSIFVDKNILVLVILNPTDQPGFLKWNGLDQIFVAPQSFSLFNKQMLWDNYMTGNEITCSLPEMIIEIKRENEHVDSDYIMNLLYNTNELRIHLKIGEHEKCREILQEMDEMLVEMRYGDWWIREYEDETT